MSDLSDQLSPVNRLDSSELVLSDLHTPTAVPRVLLLWLTFGLAGAVLFTITYLIEGAIRPGYNAWQQAISALSLGPGGWIQQANFVVYGVCTLCMAFAWRKVLKGSVYALVYPIIRGIEGLALIMVGFFSQTRRLAIHQERSYYTDSSWANPYHRGICDRWCYGMWLICHCLAFRERSSLVRLGSVLGDRRTADPRFYGLLW